MTSKKFSGFWFMQINFSLQVGFLLSSVFEIRDITDVKLYQVMKHNIFLANL